MELEGRGLIYDASPRPPAERSNAFTGLCVLRSGAVLAGFQTGSGKHAVDSTIRLCRSDDGGRTWTALPMRFDTTLNGVPGSLTSGEMVEVGPGRLQLFSTWFDRSDPAKPMYDPETQGILPTKQVWAVSADEGRTWGPWTVLPTPGLKGCATCISPLLWPDGTLAFAFESYKEAGDPSPGHHAAWLAVSRDGGRTFPELFQVARHPQDKVYYWDQRLCTGSAPGQFYAMFWTHDLEKKQDRNVHMRHGSLHEPTGQMRVWETPIRGQIAAPLLLPDGRLLAFVVDRTRPGTMKLWASPDRGATWPEKDCLVVHDHEELGRVTQGATDVDFNQYWDDMAKWTFGHPVIRLLGDGRVLLAFYAGTPGCLSIHWARVKV